MKTRRIVSRLQEKRASVEDDIRSLREFRATPSALVGLGGYLGGGMAGSHAANRLTTNQIAKLPTPEHIKHVGKLVNRMALGRRVGGIAGGLGGAYVAALPQIRRWSKEGDGKR